MHVMEASFQYALLLNLPFSFSRNKSKSTFFLFIFLFFIFSNSFLSLSAAFLINGLFFLAIFMPALEPVSIIYSFPLACISCKSKQPLAIGPAPALSQKAFSSQSFVHANAIIIVFFLFSR